MAEAADAERRAGPGDRLRSAREQRGLSARDAAAQLRLDPAVIEALEADDYASLPAPIFVKGYLNAYARLLGIPADECVAEYTAAVDGAPPPPLVVRRGTGDDLDASSSGRLAAVSWLVAVVAVAMVVLWWYTPRETAESAAAVGPQADAARPLALERVPVDTASEEPVAAEHRPVETELRPVETELRPVEAEPEAVNASPSPEPVAAVDPVAARLTYRDASWTEVVDGDGERLYFDLARAGSVVQVSGTPPLSVFLGNSPGVDVEFEGRPFDQSRYERSGNVARFTLGEPE